MKWKLIHRTSVYIHSYLFTYWSHNALESHLKIYFLWKENIQETTYFFTEISLMARYRFHPERMGLNYNNLISIVLVWSNNPTFWL